MNQSLGNLEHDLGVVGIMLKIIHDPLCGLGRHQVLIFQNAYGDELHLGREAIILQDSAEEFFDHGAFVEIFCGHVLYPEFIHCKAITHPDIARTTA
ncbi:MAG: hypothetical protein WC819_02935 [Parcubacteria group bacterium]|jgi:hypothetical protein